MTKCIISVGSRLETKRYPIMHFCRWPLRGTQRAQNTMWHWSTADSCNRTFTYSLERRSILSVCKDGAVLVSTPPLLRGAHAWSIKSPCLRLDYGAPGWKHTVYTSFWLSLTYTNRLSTKGRQGCKSCMPVQ